ncbi:hypothetical protein Gpo141_00008361 [Globisporangium polare]
MAAENALQPDPHRDGAKNPAEQLADVPLYASASASTSAHKSHHHRPQQPAAVVTTERTPLMLKIDTSRRSSTLSSAEEVHPLPWFRSPEWGRKSPQTTNGRRGSGQNQQQKRRRGRGSADDSNSSSAIARWWCFGRSDASSDRDVEIGVYGGRNGTAVGTADDADGFRQCIQLLVALILVVAIALIFMIVFQPFHESAGPGGW